MHEFEYFIIKDLNTIKLTSLIEKLETKLCYNRTQHWMWRRLWRKEHEDYSVRNMEKIM